MKFQFCFNTLKTAFLQNVSEQIRNAQAVCVTTHKGSWVKLLMYLISVVTWSSIASHTNVLRGSSRIPAQIHCDLSDFL